MAGFLANTPRLLREAAAHFAVGEPVRAADEHYLFAPAAFDEGSRIEARRRLDESRRAEAAKFEGLQARFRQLPIASMATP